MPDILPAVLSLGLLGLLFGGVLAYLSKKFTVTKDERIPLVEEALPGANCGACGYPGCAGLAAAIVVGKAPATACPVGGETSARKIGALMGVEVKPAARYRAQVLCSGTHDLAKLKYKYVGIPSCEAAMRLGGGDKTCPYGCLGYGSCVSACKFGAIKVINGVAAVDYEKCTACGQCVDTCPKGIIRLMRFESKYWVGCMSRDRGPVTRQYCNVGCIACGLCKKACKFDAIEITDSVARINHDKCTECGECVKVCPRKVIWTNSTQQEGETVSREAIDTSV